MLNESKLSQTVTFNRKKARLQFLPLQCRIASGHASENLSLRGGERANIRKGNADHVFIML